MMTMKMLGIDEAGRGPVIGPMVICGVLIDSSKEAELRRIGVKDSKLLTPDQRSKLFKKIIDIADDYVIIKLSAKKINELMKTKNLNKIEIETMAKIIDMMQPDVAYIDSPEVDTKKFEQKILSLVKASDSKIIAENYADKKYPVVSAASVLAKVTRDEEIEKIKKKLGAEIGSGYPSDERTTKYLERLISEGKENEYIRRKWITYKRLKNKYSQINLKNFKDDGHEK